jgi:hypothetical protein
MSEVRSVDGGQGKKRNRTKSKGKGQKAKCKMASGEEAGKT